MNLKGALNIGYWAAGAVFVGVIYLFSVTSTEGQNGDAGDEDVIAAEYPSGALTSELEASEENVEAPTTTQAADVDTSSPATEIPLPSTTVATTTTQPAEAGARVFTEAEIVSLLKLGYDFDERSERVRLLQYAIGETPDGHYGPKTRWGHLTQLEARGMDTSIVPSIPGAEEPEEPEVQVTMPEPSNLNLSETAITSDRPIYIVGDSLTQGVEMHGFESLAAEAGLNIVSIDAKVGRPIRHGDSVIQGWGELPADSVVLVALGTNDWAASSDSLRTSIVELIDALGGRQAVWVDLSDNINGAGNNTDNIIGEVVGSYGNVDLADWSVWEQANGVIRAGDGVHYGTSGYKLRGQFYIESLLRYVTS